MASCSSAAATRGASGAGALSTRDSGLAQGAVGVVVVVVVVVVLEEVERAGSEALRRTGRANCCWGASAKGEPEDEAVVVPASALGCGGM